MQARGGAFPFGLFYTIEQAEAVPESGIGGLVGHASKGPGILFPGPLLCPDFTFLIQLRCQAACLILAIQASVAP